MPEWVDVKAAAWAGKVHPEVMRRWCRAGRVKARHLGGKVWRVQLDDEGLPADGRRRR